MRALDRLVVLSSVAAILCFLQACGSDESSPPATGAGGSANGGSAGTAQGGASGGGQGGTAGSSTGGSATGGAAGTASGGSAGSSEGGAAGTAQGGAAGASPGGAAGAGGSGGGTGADLLKADLDGTTTEFTENMMAFLNTKNSTTQITGSKSVTGMVSSLSLAIKASATGTYDCSNAAAGNFITYVGPSKADPSKPASYNSMMAGAACTIEIATYDGVGGKISGTFSGTVKAGASDVIVMTKGEFNVTRAADK